MKYIYFFFFSLLFFGCADDEYPVTFEVDQVIQLLTNDKSKVWLLESESECRKDDLTTFSKAAKTGVAGKYWVKKGAVICPEENQNDIVGSWEVINSGGRNTLRIYAKDTVNYEIALLTASQLHLLAGEDEHIYYAR